MNLTANDHPRSRWTLVLTLLLAGVLLVLAFRGTDWNDMWRTVRSGRLDFLALAFVMLSFSYFCRGVRWRVLLSAEKKLPYTTVFWANMVGYLGNNFLPARAGELIRATLIGHRGGISKSFALATALTERILDTIVLVLISLVALVSIDDMPDWLTTASRGMAALGAVGLAGLIIAPYMEAQIKQVLARLPLSNALQTRLVSLIERFLVGMRAFQHRKRGAGFLALTGVIWLMDALVAVRVASAFDLSLSVSEAFLLLAALGLSSAAPSTPGYVGIYQFVAVTVLVPLGPSRDQALAYIIAFQALIYAVVITWGGIGLWQSRSDRGALRSVSTEEN